MGFWDAIFGKSAPRKRTRGPGRSVAERQKLEELRYLRELKRTNPALYNELMLKRLGLSADQKDELAQLQATIDRLKKMGLIKSANDLDDGKTWLKDALAGLGILLQGMQAGQSLPPPIRTGETHDGAGRGNPGGEPHSTPPPQGEEAPMDMLTLYLNSQLGGKTPQEAARWLMAQQRAEAKALVAEIIRRPEGEAYGLLLQIATAQPELRGVGNWLRSQGEAWVTEVARELHRLNGPGGSAKMGF